MKDIENAQLGLYYNSTLFDSIMDLHLFTPEDCKSVRHCTQSSTGYIEFTIDNADFVALNLMPQDESKDMKMMLDYRLVNSQESQFIEETLVLMGLGFLLIFGFIIFLFNALKVNV